MSIPIFPLGCHPAREDRRTLDLGKYLNLSRLSITEQAQAQSAFDWSYRWDRAGGSYIPYPMAGNNRYKDCVFASACHQLITWIANTHPGSQVITEADALDAYHRLGLFQPGINWTDHGASMLLTAVQWRVRPIAGHKLAAFVSVDRNNEAMVAAASWLCGGLWIGWNWPLAWQGAEEWNVSPTGSTEGKWAPRSWGPHATHGPAISPQTLPIITWGGRLPATWPAFHAYSAECYGLLSADLWATLEGGLCPSGFDFERLKHDLQEVTK